MIDWLRGGVVVGGKCYLVGVDDCLVVCFLMFDYCC